MKKSLLALSLVLLASCAREYLLERPEPETKEEKPLWWVLQKKEAGKTLLEYEDRFYEYEASFEYIRPGANIQRNILYGQCPIEEAEYRVTDKSTGRVVRRERMGQMPCGQCHLR